MVPFECDVNDRDCVKRCGVFIEMGRYVVYFTNGTVNFMAILIPFIKTEHVENSPIIRIVVGPVDVAISLFLGKSEKNCGIKTVIKRVQLYNTIQMGLLEERPCMSPVENTVPNVILVGVVSYVTNSIM
tara:strand:+ start:455 stop:841 length:387 start_codon:yes stop_codon:yes gene_type:complete